jgi:multidrug efflux pump subunit AcrB
MDRLIGYFVHRHLLVHVMTAAIVVLGYRAAVNTPRETFPDVTLNQLIVQAALAGASAQDVETKVTIPIEEAVDAIDGVKRHYTIITDNLSLTTVELDDDITLDELDEAEKDLRSEIDAINDFPADMEDDPVILRVSAQKLPVLEIALAGPSVEVAETARMLERKLERLDQVSRVTAVGLRDAEVRVLVDPVRARELGVSLLDVVAAIESRNVSSTGGSLETDADRRQVVLWSRYDDPEDVGDTILRFAPGSGAVRIHDVARIELGREDTGLLAHTDGRPGVSLVVQKQADADILDAVDTAMALMEATPLPEGVTWTIARDESYWTRNRLELITANGLVGAVLIAIALFVFLSPGVSVWVLVGIPVVFLGVLAVFPVVGLSVNIVTLTGLVVVLGMIVDDAVVVAERIVTFRQEGLDPAAAAVRGTAEVAWPVLASAITTMLAFIPLWAVGGMAGTMSASMPTGVVRALVISLFESFFILPGHMAISGGTVPPPKRAFVVAMEEWYRRFLGRVLARRLAICGIFVAVLVVVMVVVAPRLSVAIFPQEDAEAVFARVTMPLGTPIEQTEALAASIEAQLTRLMGKDLSAVTARIGHLETQNQGFERERGAAENEASVRAVLRRDKRRRTPQEWMAILERDLVIPADTDLVFEAAQVGPPMGLPVTIHVAGNDDGARRTAALEIAAWLRGVGGVVNVDVDERPGMPQIDLNLDYEKLALLGLSARDVGNTLKAAFHGIEASEHRDLDETTELRVMLDPAARGSLDSLLELPVRSASGTLVRLRDVVRPVETASVSRIYHRYGVRTATVAASFAAGSPLTALSMAERIDTELLPRFASRPDVDVYQGGEAVESRRTTAGVSNVALMAFAAVTVVIALMLGSFVEAFLVIAIVPFAIAAVVLVFFVHDTPFTLFAMMGTIGLAGVVVNASIVMVDAIHRRLEHIPAAERHLHDDEMIDAVVGRLRPILVTSITTLGGVLPMAYGIGGYDFVVAPMSLALGWGLGLSTLVTLVLVPALYSIASDLRRGGRRRPVLPRATADPGVTPIAAPPDRNASRDAPDRRALPRGRTRRPA